MVYSLPVASLALLFSVPVAEPVAHSGTLIPGVEVIGVPPAWDDPAQLQKRVASITLHAGSSGEVMRELHAHWRGLKLKAVSRFELTTDYHFEDATLEHVLDTLADVAPAFHWAPKGDRLLLSSELVTGGRVSVKYGVADSLESVFGPLPELPDGSDELRASRVQALAELIEEVALPSRPAATRSGRRVQAMGDYAHVWVTRREHRSVLRFLEMLQGPEALRREIWQGYRDRVDLYETALDRRVEVLAENEPLRDLLKRLAMEQSIPIIIPLQLGIIDGRRVTRLSSDATLGAVLNELVQPEGLRALMTLDGILIGRRSPLYALPYAPDVLARAFPPEGGASSGGQGGPQNGLLESELWRSLGAAADGASMAQHGRVIIVRAPLAVLASLQRRIEDL